MGLVVRVLLPAAAALALAAPVPADAHSTHTGRGDGAGSHAVPVPTSSPVAPVLARAGDACRAGLVALTFDDGPAPGVTQRLVRILQREQVPATFFLIGRKVQASPGIARLLAQTGFTIGNHTWSHPQLTRLPDRAVRRQVRSTSRELRLVGITPSDLMRPPYGDVDARVRADVRELGLVPVLWNVDSVDWRGGGPRRIADSILGQLRRHRDNIVLQHDGVRNSPASVAAVPRVIREARRRGYCFGALGPHGHVVVPVPTAEPPAPDPASLPTVRAHPVTGSPFDDVLTRA